MEQALLMANIEAFPDQQANVGRFPGGQLPFGRDGFFEGFALHERPGQVVHATGGANIDEGNHGGMTALLEGTNLAAGNADVPQTAPR